MGAVITPDMSRFNRSAGDVVKQTVLGITLGEYVIGLIGVLLALALKTNDVVAIVTSTSGFVGTLVVIAATLKINDWNLYAASPGRRELRRPGARPATRPRARPRWRSAPPGRSWPRSASSTHFTDFLVLLGVVFPPIAGIMVAEYFVVRTHRAELEASRAVDRLPATAPTWVPATLVVWVGRGGRRQVRRLGAAVDQLARPGVRAHTSRWAGWASCAASGRSPTGTDLGLAGETAPVAVAEPVGR